MGIPAGEKRGSAGPDQKSRAGKGGFPGPRMVLPLPGAYYHGRDQDRDGARQMTEDTPFSYSATRDNFPALVLENSRRGLVVVDFWSPRAGPSGHQRDRLTRLAESLGGRFLLVTVNTDREPQLAREYGVHSLPSLRLFRHGRVVEEVRGVQPEAEYRRLVERHLAGPGDQVQTEVLAAWQAGRREQALTRLAEAALADPADPALPLLMAKLLMQQGRQTDAHALLAALPVPAAEAPEVVQLLAHLDFLVSAAAAPEPAVLQARLEAAPQDAEARYQLAARSLLADAYEPAMEQLLWIERHQPEYRGGVARRGLLALFRMLDPGDERVRRFRAEWARLSH
jgi:putative thioredoxin